SPLATRSGKAPAPGDRGGHLRPRRRPHRLRTDVPRGGPTGRGAGRAHRRGLREVHRHERVLRLDARDVRHPLLEVRERYEAILDDYVVEFAVPRLDGAIELIEAIQARGVKTAIATQTRPDWVASSLVSAGL